MADGEVVMIVPKEGLWVHSSANKEVDNRLFLAFPADKPYPFIEENTVGDITWWQIDIPEARRSTFFSTNGYIAAHEGEMVWATKTVGGQG